MPRYCLWFQTTPKKTKNYEKKIQIDRTSIFHRTKHRLFPENCTAKSPNPSLGRLFLLPFFDGFYSFLIKNPLNFDVLGSKNTFTNVEMYYIGFLRGLQEYFGVFGSQNIENLKK